MNQRNLKKVFQKQIRNKPISEEIEALIKCSNVPDHRLEIEVALILMKKQTRKELTLEETEVLIKCSNVPDHRMEIKADPKQMNMSQSCPTCSYLHLEIELTKVLSSLHVKTKLKTKLHNHATENIGPHHKKPI